MSAIKIKEGNSFVQYPTVSVQGITVVQTTGTSTTDVLSQKAVADNYVAKVSGKGLSTEDYTTADQTKLSGIATGAEVNVQSDWNVTDTSSDAYIANKPTNVSAFTNDSNYATETYVGNQIAVDHTVQTSTSSGGTLSLDGSKAMHLVTLTGNVSALTLSTNPTSGYSTHIIFTATSEYTVAIAYDSTNRITPDADDVTFTVPADGYVEINFLNLNNKIFVRGV